ncbi:MAG: tRNA (adenosine(37)-N6)-threonylcarbamoyltransferase complex ATPase subunit type 1 TsaE, partial [Aquificaceae bacterium]|nr:tRNA (adenosine(37)-N6)-threonylcarbamoyltransferase complex ATPase subunit type 1 TsaE [Aquificaceae bacterium]
MQIFSNSEEETIKLGEVLAGLLTGDEVLCLVGGLGAGKTTLVKGIAKG